MRKTHLDKRIINELETIRGKIDPEHYYMCFLSIIAYKYLAENLESSKIDVNYKGLLKKIKQGEDITSYIEKSLSAIESFDLSLNHIFKEYMIFNSVLGSDDKSINNKLVELINTLESALENYTVTEVFNSIINFLYTGSFKMLAEHTTPYSINKLICMIACSSNANINSVYDGTLGIGNTLVNFTSNKNVKLSGQEINGTSFNLAKLNLLLNGVKLENLDITIGNTLSDDSFSEEKFDVVVGNPPFAMRWDYDETILKDKRFNEYEVLAPKSKADIAFLQNMITHLKDDGIMIAVVSHGVLFRGGTEAKIRKLMIDKYNYIDAVIGLSANLMSNTAIPVVLLVFKKNKLDTDIQFIDASSSFEKHRYQNVLSEKHLNEILDTYASRCDVDKYSHVASITEIQENDFNLNISRYVDSFEEEPQIEISKLIIKHQSIKKSEAKIKHDILIQLASFDEDNELKKAISEIIQ